MKIWLIILAVYVALDILTAIGIYTILRLKGWTPYEMARRFRQAMSVPYEDLMDEVADEVNEMREEWDKDDG